MKKAIAGKVGTSLSAKGAITGISIERMLRPETTAHGDGPGITEARAVEANSVHPKKE